MQLTVLLCQYSSVINSIALTRALGDHVIILAGLCQPDGAVTCFCFVSFSQGSRIELTGTVSHFSQINISKLIQRKTHLALITYADKHMRAAPKVM